LSPIAEVGPRNARTDRGSGMRFYTWNGVEYPSVTTLRRMAGISFPLHQWAISQVVNRAVDSISDQNRMLSTNDPLVVQAAKTWLRLAADEERDRAASLGKRVHSAASEGKPLGKVDPDVVPYLRQYQNWLDETGFKVLRSESQCFNLSKGYAGSFDLLGIDKDGDIHVVDLKTGKNTYPEHALQVTAYSLAEFVGEDDVIDTDATAWLRAANSMSLLHVRPEGWEWQRIDIDRYMVVAFNGLLAFAKWAHAHPDMGDLLDFSTGGAAL
jgi:hypothetical protein